MPVALVVIVAIAANDFLPIRQQRPVMVSLVANSITPGIQAGVNIGPYVALEAQASSIMLISFLDLGARAYLMDTSVAPFVTARFSKIERFHISGQGQDCASDPLEGDCDNEYPLPESGIYLGIGVEMTAPFGFNVFLSGGILKYLQRADESLIPHGTLGLGWRF